MNNCIFCKIASNEIPADQVYENDKILAFLDINPVNLGHVLIIPKQHFNDLLETSDEIVCEMMKVAKQIGSVMHEAIGADGFNLGLNNGEAAGQIVKHVHLHVMPRFSDDGLKLWPGKQVSSQELKNTAEKIRLSLEKSI